jgi:hypothetical protein
MSFSKMATTSNETHIAERRKYSGTAKRHGTASAALDNPSGWEGVKSGKNKNLRTDLEREPSSSKIWAVRQDLSGGTSTMVRRTGT